MVVYLHGIHGIAGLLFAEITTLPVIGTCKCEREIDFDWGFVIDFNCFLSLYICQSVCLFVCLFVCLCVCLSLDWTGVSVFVSLPVCPPACLSVHLFCCLHFIFTTLFSNITFMIFLSLSLGHLSQFNMSNPDKLTRITTVPTRLTNPVRDIRSTNRIFF